MQKRRKPNGITIVSLVITIILLLILAGISLQAFTGSGLFQNATDAKEQTKLAQLEEQMKLTITEMIADKNGAKITIDDYIKYLTETEKMNITNRYEEDGKQIIEIDNKYIFEISDDDTNISVEKVGIKEKLPPKIILSSITGTTNSITVQVETQRNEGGKIEYYIKTEDEENYVLKKTTTDTSYTYTELVQNKKYNVKIVAVAENEQTAEVLVDRTLGSVPDLKEGDITFTYSPAQGTWTKGSVTATASTTITGYTLQTSKDGKTWSNETSQTFTGNGKIYAVLYDGTNYGGSATGNVTNIDTQAPKDFTPTATSTTKSITVTASAEDADATTTSAKSGISGYRFKLDSGSWTEYQTRGTYTWDNLTQTTSHTITVEAKDNAGNTKQGTVTKGTGTVTSGTTAGAITFGTTTWSGGKASTTISTNTSYTIQYQVNSITGEWKTGTSVTELVHGNQVYARLWDGTNAGTASAANNILDGTDPSANISLSSTSTDTASSITATVTHTDNESGVKIANCKWVYNTISSSIGTDSSSYTGTFSSASQTITLSATTAGTYYLHVLTTDVAGRTVETISNAVTVKADPSLPSNPATTIAEAQSDYMLIKTVNSPIQDAYGNKITVPAGFKIKADSTTNNATTVDKGIVIIDSSENEFVWIPTGKIYTDTAKTEANAKTINLNRYTFDSNGNPTAQNEAVIDIDIYCQELATSTYGNTTAKDINDFKAKASATGSGGFYVGRYEARTATARSAATDALTTLTTKSSDYVYNYVTQLQAAERCQTMYGSDKTFTSDLMNSYAWDTATLFLQTCGNNTTPYSRQNCVNTSLATTGTNNKTTKDFQCNVYDMASNVREWTTETCSGSSFPFIFRGGGYYGSIYYTSTRSNGGAFDSDSRFGFRPLLYV